MEVRMSRAAVVALCAAVLLGGCGAGMSPAPVVAPIQAVTSVTPSATGIPLGVAVLGEYEFVSVQQTGQIFTYSVASGAQVPAVQPYSTPCADPSGMVLASIAGKNVLAVPCYDTGTLLTLNVAADGSLSALGSVSGLGTPYPGTALDGTNVLVPLFGVSQSANGGVAKIDISSPAKPVITGVATLASPGPGEFANPGALTVANGYIYVAAGAESYPLATSSTIQVVQESTMSVVGSPLVVAHSPQQIAVQGSVAFVTFYDAMQLESIDIAQPASLSVLQVYSLGNAEGAVEKLDISNPAAMATVQAIEGIAAPQAMAFAGQSLLVTSSVNGGSVYDVYVGSN
jgi:hypothetical protein